MTADIFLVLMMAAVSALMTLVFFGLLVACMVRFFWPEVSWRRWAHEGLLLLAYAFFPVQVWTNLAAFGGTLGDGPTSLYRNISLFTLLAVPCLQLALFVLWHWLRSTVFRGAPSAIGIAAVAPAVIPTLYVLFLIGIRYHWIS